MQEYMSAYMHAGVHEKNLHDDFDVQPLSLVVPIEGPAPNQLNVVDRRLLLPPPPTRSRGPSHICRTANASTNVTPHPDAAATRSQV